MSQTKEICELACEQLSGTREGWEVHLQAIGDDAAVCAVDRGTEDPDSVYAWISRSEASESPFLVWVFRPEDDGDPISTGAVSSAALEQYVFSRLEEAERGRGPEAAGELALGGTRSQWRGGW